MTLKLEESGVTNKTLYHLYTLGLDIELYYSSAKFVFFSIVDFNEINEIMSPLLESCLLLLHLYFL